MIVKYVFRDEQAMQIRPAMHILVKRITELVAMILILV